MQILYIVCVTNAMGCDQTTDKVHSLQIKVSGEKKAIDKFYHSSHLKLCKQGILFFGSVQTHLQCIHAKKELGRKVNF